ncbi:MAG TPA: hypothetical protein HPP77_06965 [Candidatus Hydrogenedentes bacterium]|nr:hypothetical protein [Candidatus Hydrogenedentota bacterium]
MMETSTGTYVRLAPIALALVLMACSGGCVTRVGDFSLMSTGTPQYEKMGTAHITSGVRGSDGRFWILFLPFDRPPSIETAVNECQDRGRGDFMERARVERMWWTLIVFSYDQYSCKGDVGDTKRLQREVTESR